MLTKKILNSIFLWIALIFFALNAGAQVRSSTVQTIDGSKYYIHKIEKNQSLYGISKLYNISIEELQRVNPELKNGAKLNQLIKVPTVAPTQTVAQVPPAAQTNTIDTVKYCTYKVAKGETSYSISKKFNLSEKEFTKFNPNAPLGLKENQYVIVGERKKNKN